MGDNIVLFGGEDSTGYLNDLSKYSVRLNAWEQLHTVSDDFPSTRISACIALWTPFVYLYGGKTALGASNELWVYDTQTSAYTLLDDEVLVYQFKLCIRWVLGDSPRHENPTQTCD